MRFIHPEFLFALFALAIPIIIHLFNFRKFKKIFFTNVRFLREIKQDTQSKSKLKHLLILLSRLLAVAFLVLAFAQPYIPAGNQQKRKSTRKISIFIDNSFSMDAVSKEGALLKVAQKKAHDIAMAFSPSDQFQLLTNDFKSTHQRLLSREEFLLETDQVQQGPSAKSLSEILTRQHDALFTGNADAESDHIVYILSDFQKSQMKLENLSTDSSMTINFIPLQSVHQQNLYVDTCFLNTPFIQLNASNELTVRIKNNGEEAIENIPLKLLINGEQKSLASISLNGNSTSDVKLSFTVSKPGWQKAELSITDFPVTFDDTYFFSFNVRPSVQLLAINGKTESPNLNALYQSDPYFILKNANSEQLDYSAFRNYQLILLNEISNLSSGLVQELKRYVQQGGQLFIIPAPDANLSTYNDLMTSIGGPDYLPLNTIEEKVSKIENDHIIFKDVFEKKNKLPENLDLPLVHSYYSFSKTTKNKEEPLMKLQNGNTFLSTVSFGNGQVYFLAVPLETEFSNFARHALFVPIFIKSALNGSSEISSPLIIGKNNEISYRDSILPGDNVLHLKNEALNFDIIPEVRKMDNSMILSVHDQISNSGSYQLYADKTLLSEISFNFDRIESDLTCYTTEELEKTMNGITGIKFSVIQAEGKDLSHTINQLNEGKPLWKICITLVLLFLAAEILLIRFFRS